MLHDSALFKFTIDRYNKSYSPSFTAGPNISKLFLNRVWLVNHGLKHNLNHVWLMTFQLLCLTVECLQQWLLHNIRHLKHHQQWLCTRRQDRCPWLVVVPMFGRLPFRYWMDADLVCLQCRQIMPVLIWNQIHYAKLLLTSRCTVELLWVFILKLACL